MIRLYRQSSSNENEMIEYLGNYSTPSGRVFTRTDNPPASTAATPVITIKNPSTGVVATYILSRLG